MAGRRWLGTVIAGAMLWAPAARGAVLRASDLVAVPGDAVEVAVSLASGSDRVAGTQNDLELAPPLRWAGDETCVANPAIDKGGTAFAFGPCEGGGVCDRVRAIVIALDNVDPIPDGSELYRCRVAIDPEAPAGVYPIAVTNPGASDPEGNPLVIAGVGGRIVVGDVAPAMVRVEDRIIYIGDFTPLAVRLGSSAGAATVSVDLVLGEAVHITSGIQEEPHCSSALSGATATFAFQPPGCSPDRDTCTTMRATVRSPQPLPNDTLLFDCTLFPVPVIDPGDYVADCAADAADAAGDSVPAVCLPGTLQVLEPDLEPGPDATPTASPSGRTPAGTPTGVRASPTPTAALRATAPTSAASTADDDGCQVAPPAGAVSILPLVGAGLLLARRRRRR